MRRRVDISTVLNEALGDTFLEPSIFIESLYERAEEFLGEDQKTEDLIAFVKVIAEFTSSLVRSKVLNDRQDG